MERKKTRLLGGRDLANLSPRDLALLLSSAHDWDEEALLKVNLEGKIKRLEDNERPPNTRSVKRVPSGR